MLKFSVAVHSSLPEKNIQACFSQLLKLSTLLRLSFICLKCISAVQIYEFHIFISYLLHSRVYYEHTSDQLPVG